MSDAAEIWFIVVAVIVCVMLGVQGQAEGGDLPNVVALVAEQFWLLAESSCGPGSLWLTWGIGEGPWG